MPCLGFAKSGPLHRGLCAATPPPCSSILACIGGGFGKPGLRAHGVHAGKVWPVEWENRVWDRQVDALEKSALKSEQKAIFGLAFFNTRFVRPLYKQ